MLIVNANALIDGKFVKNACVRFSEGVISEAGTGLLPCAGEQVKDLEGRALLPGFVDVHTHACMGHDTMQGEQAVRSMSRVFAEHGVAAFLPTTMSASAEDTRAALRGIRAVMKAQEPFGARVCGAHMEAPFISPEKHGAQAGVHLRAPSKELFLSLCDGDPSVVRLITLAPELEGAEELICYLVSLGVRVSCGHTAATSEQTRRAVDLGLDHSTHTFNAQPPLLHRAPGAAGALLTDDRVYCEMIADGIHLHPDILKLIFLCKGREKTVAVTDSMEAALMPDGRYALGGQAVYVKNGEARLQDGTLAGSVLTMERAFRNLIAFGFSPEDAAYITTASPADSAGIRDHGRIRQGCRAFFTVWDDEWNRTEIISG